MKESPPIFIKDISDIQPMASIHATGKLCFNKAAVELMELSKGECFLIAKGKKGKCFFLFPTKDSTNALVITKRGFQYGFNETNIFRKIGCLRKEKYLITPEIYQGETIYKIHL